MPTYRHPRARDDVPGHPPSSVHISRAENADVNADGEFTAPEAVGRSVAQHHGVDEGDIRVTDTDASEESADDAGDTEGCPYCDDYDGDHVEQHVAQAHPEEGD